MNSQGKFQNEIQKGVIMALVNDIVDALDDTEIESYFRHCQDCNRLTEWIDLKNENDDLTGCLECGQVHVYKAYPKMDISRVNNVNLFI